ncbi:acetylcholine receptor subunit alpha-like [Cephus cinctus]|uniref:Acetylcholine receptor subunit alpha-like n=1 Tax=Cephus cinctus TaxID=211228 RepID=A0AAJ7RS69_CEPCN|nr:acetylcholine receptor subunit alpha-like [Cephus cinctus]
MRNLFFNLFVLAIMYRDHLWVRAIECKDLESKSTMMQLRRHLFCDYDYSIRPIFRKENVTTVELKLAPKMINFEESTNFLVLHSWLALSWHDEHLRWNPAGFDSIELIHVTFDEIWRPDISVYNAGETSDWTSLPATQCSVNNNGLVNCLPEVKYVTHCDADYTNWPFDIQTCTVRLVSAYHIGEVDFRLMDEGITMLRYVGSVEWNLLNVTVTKEIIQPKWYQNDTLSTISFIFIIERHSGMMETIYITPCIILIVMTLTTLWLDPNTAERMIVAVINFICHLLTFQDLHWNVPRNGPTVPRILIFYRDSLAMAGFAIFLTTFLRQLHAISRPAPGWISSINTFILNNKVGQIFLLNTLDPKASAGLETEADDNSGLVQLRTSSRDNDQSWSLMAIFIGRLSFIGVLLTYIIMLFLLLPVVTEIRSYDRSIMMGK